MPGLLRISGAAKPGARVLPTNAAHDRAGRRRFSRSTCRQDSGSAAGCSSVRPPAWGSIDDAGHALQVLHLRVVEFRQYDGARIDRHVQRAGEELLGIAKAAGRHEDPGAMVDVPLFRADLDAAIDLAHRMHGVADDRGTLLRGHGRLRLHLGSGTHMASGVRLIQADAPASKASAGNRSRNAAASYVSYTTPSSWATVCRRAT